MVGEILLTKKLYFQIRTILFLSKIKLCLFHSKFLPTFTSLLVQLRCAKKVSIYDAHKIFLQMVTLRLPKQQISMKKSLLKNFYATFEDS